MQGTILKAISGFYYVSVDGITYECKARGNFRSAGISPLVGDRVEISVTDAAHGVVEEIFPRRSLIERPLIANIDKLIIVSAYEVPAPDALMIDRLTATAVYQNIQPVIVFNKSDLGDFSAWERIYRLAGFPVYTVSAQHGDGIDALRPEFDGCISAVAGNSGVGKSSLLNVLFGGLSLQTGEVSRKLGRGRHTTRHTELFAVGNGGFVADTPGFSSLEKSENYEFKEHLAECFPDFSEAAEHCHFTSCSHTKEKNCGVLAAVAAGEIAESRHGSYCAILEEMRDLKPWNSQNTKKR